MLLIGCLDINDELIGIWVGLVVGLFGSRTITLDQLWC